MSNWISVKDRLPAKEKVVVVYDQPLGILTCGAFCNTFAENEWLCDLEDFTVTHWADVIPLPLPKQEQDDG